MKADNITELSAENIRLVMRQKRPMSTIQGMAIYEDEIFQLYHTGWCGIFSLKEKNEQPLALFPLGSANSGEPDKNYTNHSNQCMFSSIHKAGNPLPLLYVTGGYGTGGDENGYFYRCMVENIELERDEKGKVTGGKSSLLQTISYKDGPLEDSNWIQPCWGCPAWFVDSENGFLYMFSCVYRTTEAFFQYNEQNRYIITRFRMPDPFGERFVLLSASDILDQFVCPYDIPFTQGGMIYGDKLYYTFGCGREKYPNGLRIFDLKEKRLCAKMDLSKGIFADEEIESCSYYKGELLVNTNTEHGGYYTLGRILEQI